MSEAVVMDNAININKDFSTYPMGRSDEDGPDNGQRFFLQFLLPLISENQPVIVEMDGPRVYGSSFLDEAFHVMPKKHGFNYKQFSKLVTLIARDPVYAFYKRAAEQYMKDIGS